MGDLIIPSDKVEEVAQLLDRPARDLEAEDILGALRYRARPGHDVGEADGYRAAQVDRRGNLEALFRPMHDDLGERMAETAEGRQVITAHEELEAELRQIDERARSEEVDREVLAHDKIVLLDRFHREHEREILALAAESAELQPSPGMILRATRPSDLESPRPWRAEVTPNGGMLIQGKAAPDDAASTGQGTGAPWVPPAVSVCHVPPYPEEYAHEDTSAVGYDWRMFAFGQAGNVKMEPAVWPPGEVSGHAIVGGPKIAVPAGPYSYQAEIHYEYEYNASCWSFMSIAGAGADFYVEIDKGDGTPKEMRADPLFYIISTIVGGNGAAENATRTVTFPFTRDGSQAGEINIMAGISAHAEAGGSPFSGYAGVTFDHCIVKKICVKSL